MSASRFGTYTAVSKCAIRLGTVLLAVALSTAAFGLSACAASRHDRIDQIAKQLQSECIAKGWQHREAILDGRSRQLMWKGPARWDNGVIIFFHGGGGVDSNICANYLALDEPMVRFGERAVAEGFAVVALDSTQGLVKDPAGLDCGKRWDALAHDGQNIDLKAVEGLITDVIPRIRPSGSAPDIFMTGISDGGFMTILAATHLSRYVTAFAPVSAGDPYGTVADCKSGRWLRPTAPGVLKDRETGVSIADKGAGGPGMANELTWPAPTGAALPAFRQFHHMGDGAVDLSVMYKARRMLTAHGFRGVEPFIINASERGFRNHFWKDPYTEQILNFFRMNAGRHRDDDADPAHAP